MSIAGFGHEFDPHGPGVNAQAIINFMILVTGATGFIGRALLRQLFETGRDVRVMIRPSRRSPRLPKGRNIDVAVVSFSDERAM